MIRRRAALAVLVLLWMTSATADDDALSVITKADDLARGESSVSDLTMTIATPRWTREVSIRVWTKGRDRSFMLVESPVKDAGTTFLKIGNEMWNWLPQVERKVKIPPSMMLQSWMGSDFTNDDVARADSMITDYTHKIAGEKIVDGQACWEIESIPKSDAPVFWGKVVTLVQKEGFIYRRSDYYDEDMKIAKSMVLDEIKTMSGRRLATRMRMENLRKPGNTTTLVFRSIEFDAKIPDDVFTQDHLSKAGRRP